MAAPAAMHGVRHVPGLRLAVHCRTTVYPGACVPFRHQQECVCPAQVAPLHVSTALCWLAGQCSVQVLLWNSRGVKPHATAPRALHGTPLPQQPYIS